MPGISVRNIRKKFGDVEAVRNASFDCQSGQFFCLLGPSGAGKTTILKMIAGVEEVTSGEIYIDNCLVNDIRPQERDVAMMFENYALYPHLTVYENMASPYTSAIRKSRYSSEEVEKIIKEVARSLSIENLLARYPKELSGGQKQRAALGRALVRRPSVFLLDEPISHLDAKLRHNMRTELKKIHEEIGVSFIYATPDQLEAISMADVIAVIDRGQIQQIGTPDDVFEKPVNEFVASFMGEPPMNLFDGVLREKNKEPLLRIASFDLALPMELGRALGQKIPNGEVRAGIRPTHINIEKSRRDRNSIPAEIYVFEPFGRYAIVTAKVNGLLLKVKTRGQVRVTEGESVWLDFDLNRLYFFDMKIRTSITPW